MRAVKLRSIGFFLGTRCRAGKLYQIVQNAVDEVEQRILERLNKYHTVDEVKAFAVKEIEQRDNAIALDYLKHIDDFRYYRDQK